MKPFSGSYDEEDVRFLLRKMNIPLTPLAERERLIQSGQRHYSEMIGPEDAPSSSRLQLFRECLNVNGLQFAHDIARLAASMVASVSGQELTVVSIARAGTPVGAILQRCIRQSAPHLHVEHYSISVIRDRGIDLAALSWILQRRQAHGLRFVDGWTGKGTIARELKTSLSVWQDRPRDLDQQLWVPLDVCGAAGFAANSRDYLIPSSLLGATVSGLVSRTVLPRGNEDPSAFHGCVLMKHLRRYDLSRWFLSHMMTQLSEIGPVEAAPANASQGAQRSAETHRCIKETLARCNMTDSNRVKLGIGETVRVLLRRSPLVIWLNAEVKPSDEGIIRRLAALRGVPVEMFQDIPFAAIAIIAEASSHKESRMVSVTEDDN
jgi:Phosphoribosyl transferase (PRTase)/PELOTA RNA binding domain